MSKKHSNLRKLGPALLSALTVAILLVGCGEDDSAPIASPELLSSGAESVIYQMVTLRVYNAFSVHY